MAKANKTKAIAKTKKATAPANPGDLFNLKDNLDGVEPRLPQISILHGAQMFLLPDDSKVDKFEARILDLSRANAWWSKDMSDESSSPPDCYSVDGMTPDMNAHDVQSRECHDCQFNQFGSDPKGGKGKACKNMKRVHVVMPDNLMPYRLTLPPSSLAACDLYVSLLTSTGLPYQLLITEFSLKAGKHPGGKDFSEVVMNQVAGSSITDLDEAKAIRKLRDDWAKVMREQSLIPDEVD